MSTNAKNINKLNKRITAEQTIILIRLIKKYKCLWDTNSPHFRNRLICKKLYEKIGSYFQISGEEVRRKFRRLRNCYRQELRLMRNKRKAYTNLFYFDEMEFLREQIENRLLSTVDSAVKEEVCAVDLPTEYFEEGYAVDDSEQLQFSSKTEPLQTISIEKVDAGDISPSERPEDKLDEFDTFAEYLSSQLREMDKLSALKTMDELHRIVSKRRIESLKRKIKLDC